METTTAVPAAAAAVAVGNSSINNRALFKLRGELARHLAAVAHVPDGGRCLQEATRVMREIKELEAMNRREAEVCVGLSCGVSLRSFSVKMDNFNHHHPFWIYFLWFRGDLVVTHRRFRNLQILSLIHISEPTRPY